MERDEVGINLYGSCVVKKSSRDHRRRKGRMIDGNIDVHIYSLFEIATVLS